MPDPYREPIDDSKPPEVKSPEKPADFSAVEKPIGQEKPAAPEKVIEVVTPAVASPASSPNPPIVAPVASVATNPFLDQELDKDRQLKILVDLAFKEGIDKAVEAARASNNAYLIDKFHDTIVDELRQKLIEEGKLKEI